MPKILFCQCAYAKALPEDVKSETLRGLCESNEAFDAVPDLCEMAARRDPRLKDLAEAGPIKIAACYPRAVKGLFVSIGSPLSADETEVRNLRIESSGDALEALLHPDLKANLDEGSSEAPQSNQNEQ